MNKTAALLATAILPMVAGMGIATGSNAQSPTSDQAYCRLLVKTLREEALGMVRGLPVGNATAVAIAQCAEGDPGPAIPVLEKELRDRKITVPSRG
jgi:hypothetical protein